MSTAESRIKVIVEATYAKLVSGLNKAGAALDIFRNKISKPIQPMHIPGFNEAWVASLKKYNDAVTDYKDKISTARKELEKWQGVLEEGRKPLEARRKEITKTKTELEHWQGIAKLGENTREAYQNISRLQGKLGDLVGGMKEMPAFEAGKEIAKVSGRIGGLTGAYEKLTYRTPPEPSKDEESKAFPISIPQGIFSNVEAGLQDVKDENKKWFMDTIFFSQEAAKEIQELYKIPDEAFEKLEALGEKWRDYHNAVRESGSSQEAQNKEIEAAEKHFMSEANKILKVSDSYKTKSDILKSVRVQYGLVGAEAGRLGKVVEDNERPLKGHIETWKRFSSKMKNIGRTMAWFGFRLTMMGRMVSRALMKPVSAALGLFSKWDNSINELGMGLGMLAASGQLTGERQEEIVKAMGELVDEGPKVQGIFARLTALLANVTAPIIEKLAEPIHEIIDALNELWEISKGFVLPIFEEISNMIKNTLIPIIQEIGPAVVKNLVSGLADGIKWLGKQVAHPAIKGIITFLSGVAGWLIALAPAASLLGTVFFALSVPLQAIFSVLGFILDVGGGVLSFIINIGSAIMGFVGTLSQVLGTFSGGGLMLAGILVTAFAFITGKIEELKNAIAEEGGLVPFILQKFGELADGIAKFFGDLDLGPLIDNIIKTAGVAFGVGGGISVPINPKVSDESIWGILDKFAATMTKWSKGETAFNEIWKGIEESYNKWALETEWDPITDLKKSLEDWTGEEGQFTIAWNNITTSIGDYFKALNDGDWATVLDPVKAGFDVWFGKQSWGDHVKSILTSISTFLSAVAQADWNLIFDPMKTGLKNWAEETDWGFIGAIIAEGIISGIWSLLGVFDPTRGVTNILDKYINEGKNNPPPPPPPPENGNGVIDTVIVTKSEAVEELEKLEVYFDNLVNDFLKVSKGITLSNGEIIADDMKIAETALNNTSAATIDLIESSKNLKVIVGINHARSIGHDVYDDMMKAAEGFNLAQLAMEEYIASSRGLESLGITGDESRAPAAAGTQYITIDINMESVNISSDMDINTITDEISRRLAEKIQGIARVR